MNLTAIHQMLAKLYKPKLTLKEEDLSHWSTPCFSSSANPVAQQNAVHVCVVQSEDGVGMNLPLGAHVWVKCRQSCGVPLTTTFRRWEQRTHQNCLSTKFWLAPASERISSASTESSVARSVSGYDRIGYLWTPVSGMEIKVGTYQSLTGRGLTAWNKPRCCHVRGSYRKSWATIFL